jgi:hypothetical protein
LQLNYLERAMLSAGVPARRVIRSRGRAVAQAIGERLYTLC